MQRVPVSHFVHTGFLCFSAHDGNMLHSTRPLITKITNYVTFHGSGDLLRQVGLTFCTKSKRINEMLFALISIGKQTKHESTMKLVE